MRGADENWRAAIEVAFTQKFAVLVEEKHFAEALRIYHDLPAGTQGPKAAAESLIHPRQMHESFYDHLNLNPSPTGINYLFKIFNNAVGQDDIEDMHRSLFRPGNLTQPYHSVNVDLNKRIRYLD